MDTSAVLAFLFQERGQEVASEWLDRGATISTAYVLEVIAILVARAVKDGADPQDAYVKALRNVDGMVLDIAELTVEDALQAGAWVTFQKSANLSAGDRCCLALGKRLALPVVHAEQAWQPLGSDLGLELVLVREMRDAN